MSNSIRRKGSVRCSTNEASPDISRRTGSAETRIHLAEGVDYTIDSGQSKRSSGSDNPG